MRLSSWRRERPDAGRSDRPGQTRRRAAETRAAVRSRPHVESLEDRALLSGVSFSSPMSYGVGVSPISVTVGDLNGDGKPDLAVANADSDNVSVLLGYGDGTFQAARNFFAGGSPSSIAIGDFNGDGKPDLAVANVFGYPYGTGNVSLLLGNGDGTFQAAQTVTVGFATSLAVGDFNGDGKLDLASVNPFGNTVGNVSVLLGKGDGTFQSAQNFTAGASPFSAVVRDFNGDGKPDLAVGGGNDVSVLLGNGDGTFQTALSSPVVWASSLAVGDFNGDGKIDLATASANNNNVSVLLANGDGTFQAAENMPVGSLPTSYSGLSVSDFNGDGKLDLVSASMSINNDSSNDVNVLPGDGDGTFQTAQSFPVASTRSSLAVGDFNGDGKLDLASADFYSRDVGVLLNQIVTTTAVSGPASSTYGEAVTYTASVTSGAAPLTVGTITFLDGSTPISAALPLDANGQATFCIATLNAGGHPITASYSGTPDGVGTTGFGPSTAATSLTIIPAVLSAKAANFHTIAGAPFTGTVASFANPDPYGTAASFTATIDWGDGTTSIGTITGTSTLTVSGPHTYAAPGLLAVSVQISHDLGNTTTATVYSKANVISLGQDVEQGLTAGIGFWHNKNGQALINGFNGGSNASALSGWLAATFPNIYGAGAGANNLAGETNAQVAAFYLSQFALSGTKVQAEVLATALNVYATTRSLGGTIGRAYGFTVSGDGLGAYTFNVGANGAAFGVANKTTINVYELLQAVDRQAISGVLYNGDLTLQKKADSLLAMLNTAGSIS